MSAEGDAIKVEVQRLMNLAQQLADCAKNMNKIIGDDYASSLIELKKYWGGENATAVLAAGKKIGDDAAETVKRIVEVAQALEKVAQEYLKAEMKAKAGG